jgi:hypothetical protein
VISSKTKILASIAMISILVFCSMATCATSDVESKEIPIDDMRNLNNWHAIKDEKHNCSVDLIPVDNGLTISYSLDEKESWVDIYRHIDFSKIPKIDKLSFQFAGSGAPNTIELKLVYADGSTFGYELNRASNLSGTVSLYPWQITYWWGGPLHSDTEVVNFDEVKEMRFAISNNPDKKDMLGKGNITINKVTGETPPIPMSFWEKYGKELIAGFFGIITGIIGSGMIKRSN